MKKLKKKDKNAFNEKLGRVEFKELSGVDISKVERILYAYGDVGLMSSLSELTKAVLYDYYDGEICIRRRQSMCSYICILPLLYFGRSELIKRYEKVVDLIDNKLCVYGNKKKFGLSLNKLSLLVTWFNQIPNPCSIEHKLRILAIMVQAWQIITVYNKFKNKNRIRIARCIVLCDFQPIDTVVVQYLNNIGIETVSLQHGLYGSGQGIIENCVAKKILVYGQQAFEELVKAGICESNIVIAGMPQMIGVEERQSMQYRPIHKVGVVFSGNHGYLPDEDMLKILASIYDGKKYRIFLKIRSNALKSDYKEMIEKYDIYKVYSDEIDGIDFIDNMDLIVSGVSTMTIESVARMKPTFIYLRLQNNSYKILEDFVFSNRAELLKLKEFYEKDFTNFNRKIKQIKFYFCTENVEYNYKTFFENL